MDYPGIYRGDGGYLVGIVGAAIERERPASERRKVRVGKVDREPLLQRCVPGDSPSLEDPAQGPIGSELMGNWYLVLVAGYEALACVELRITPVETRDEGIRTTRPERGIFKARPVVLGVSIGVGKQER